MVSRSQGEKAAEIKMLKWDYVCRSQTHGKCGSGWKLMGVPVDRDELNLEY